MAVSKPQTLQLNWGSPLTKGLVLAVPFTEGSGNNVRDLVSKKMGTATTTTWVNTLLGRSINVDGSSTSKVLYTNSSLLDITGPFTLSIWVCPIGGGNFILDKNGTTSAGYGFQLNGNYFGTVNTLVININNSQLSANANVFTLGQWSHVCATFDGVSGYKVYSNSVLNRSFTAAAVPLTNTASLAIGNKTAGGAATSGNINHALLYNRALTHTEIKQLYLSPWKIYRDQQYTIDIV